MPRKPKSPFPDPAAVLPGEADILAGVIANLADHDAKLVYADWLEERGDKRGPLLRKFVQAHRAGKKKLPQPKPDQQVWANLIGLTIMARFRSPEHAVKADVLLAFVRPAVTFRHASERERNIPVGASKFGGCPDLPPKTKWPVVGGKLGAFLVQFNLAELHASPAARELPTTGLLSVFIPSDFDMNSGRKPWSLHHFPDASQLVRTDKLPRLPKRRTIPSGRVEFREIPTLPETTSPWSDELVAALRKAAGVTLWDLRDEVAEFVGGESWQLLGHRTSGRGLLTKSSQVLFSMDRFGRNVAIIDNADLEKGQLDRARVYHLPY
jgi:uncharacterized protein (TIGR02996 family)